MKENKICSFYVSEVHLLTILMPYIDEKIKENKNIVLFLENNMQDKVIHFLRHVDIFNKTEIIKLGWKKTKKEVANIKNKADIAIVIGDEGYVEQINSELDRKDIFEGIVNCYSVESIKNIKEIVFKHKFVLKTIGKCEFAKSSHNEQKRKTIKSQT